MRRILAKSDLMIEGGLLNEPGKPEDLIDRSYWQAGWVFDAIEPFILCKR